MSDIGPPVAIYPILRGRTTEALTSIIAAALFLHHQRPRFALEQGASKVPWALCRTLEYLHALLFIPSHAQQRAAESPVGSRLPRGLGGHFPQSQPLQAGPIVVWSLILALACTGRPAASFVRGSLSHTVGDGTGTPPPHATTIPLSPCFGLVCWGTSREGGPCPSVWSLSTEYHCIPVASRLDAGVSSLHPVGKAMA